MTESNLLDIADTLFDQDPNNCNLINLQFEGYELEDLFKELLQLFTLGMRKNYGDHNGVVNLKKLIDDDFKYINKFFNIIGFCVHYNIYQEDDYDLMIKEHFTFDNPSSLSDYRFKLKSEDLIYVIYFSIINNNTRSII